MPELNYLVYASYNGGDYEQFGEPKPYDSAKQLVTWLNERDGWDAYYQEDIYSEVWRMSEMKLFTIILCVTMASVVWPTIQCAGCL